MKTRPTPLAMLSLLVGAGLATSMFFPFDDGANFLPADDPRRDSMVLVRGGSFLMGSTEAQIEAEYRAYGGQRSYYESEVPQRRVSVDDFYIDRTEVTQTDFKEFAESTHREPPFVDREWAKLYNWKNGIYPGGPDGPEGLASHPVVLVTYDDAEGYCRWAGKALPTETEWEKAARGTDGRIYPWGNTWDGSRLNSASSWSDHELTRIETWTEWWKTTYHEKLRGREVTTRPVGSFPAGASPYGALDMSGNVFEWTATWYDAYPGSTYQNAEFGELYRVVRGGDWYLDRIYTRAAARLRSPPEHRVPTIGFRCVVRSPQPERSGRAK